MTWNSLGRKVDLRAAGCGLTLIYCVLTCGCGSSTAEVTGEVTFRDAPLPGGNIYFILADGKGSAALGIIDENGKYKVKAPVGDCLIYVDNRVLVEVPVIGSGEAAPKGDGVAPKGVAPSKGGSVTAPPNDMMKKMREEKGAPTATTSQRQKGTYVAIPAKYYSQTTSGLLFTVKSGKNTFPVKLE